MPFLRAHFERWAVAAVAVLSLILFGLGAGACQPGGGGDPSATVGDPAGNALLERVEWGRLVDVYGLEDGRVVLFRADVLVGSDIRDERPVGASLLDEQITYDVLSVDPDSLQERILITRELGSAEFATAFAALDERVVSVAPGVVGQDTNVAPFSVVPRNAALRLTFSRSLQVDDGFFTALDDDGRVLGFRNAEAIQLLEVRGLPGDPGALRVVPTRILGRGRQIVLDPVFLGSEGVEYNVRNNAAGMPAAANPVAANMRLAVALEGPLAIPGVREDADPRFLGVNNSGARSVIRDFRSGAPSDNSLEIAGGFLRDPVPPRLVGEVPMLLESVREVDFRTLEVTVFKDGALHDLDAGDVLRFVVGSSGVALESAEILLDPEDDAQRPEVQSVRVRVRRTPGLLDLDPRRLAGYPLGAPRADVEEFLRERAPKALAVVEYRGPHRSRLNGDVLADDPRYFVRFTSSVLPGPNGERSRPAENVSPFAGLVLRFTKPVDMASVKPLDTLFLATRNLLDRQEMDAFIAQRGIDPVRFNEDKYRTPHLVGARMFDEGSQVAVRLQPPAGFYLDDAMRDAAAQGQDYRYFLHVVAGFGGILDLAGNPLDLQADVLEAVDAVVVPFTVDARRDPATAEPFYPDNIAVSVCRRLARFDEDERPSYYMPREADMDVDVQNPLLARDVAWPDRLIEPPGYAVRSQPMEDFFGGFFLADGGLEGRPPGRFSRIVDNINQQPVAAQGSDLRWCPLEVSGQGLTAANTGNTLFGQPIQNPLNPFGARLQMVWRELDLSLSRLDPVDFNLDVEQMYWAPFVGRELVFDELDFASLYLGHSEERPEPCVGQFTANPEFPRSGLVEEFDRNYVFNPGLDGSSIESQPAPHAAFVDQPLVIDPALAVLDPSGLNRFLPLPEFQAPYFVYRDETVMEQGGNLRRGSDTGNGLDQVEPYLVSPFMGGRGYATDWVAPPGSGTFGEVAQNLTHHGFQNYRLLTAPRGAGTTNGRGGLETATGGLLPSVALPLLAEWQVACDLPHLPMGAGYVALGVNGWQVALSVTSNRFPYFRVYSAGAQAFGARPAVCVEPGSEGWDEAAGGFRLNGLTTDEGDNSVYWTWCDFLRRQTVVTGGFCDLRDPHRVFDFAEVDPQLRSSNDDPRLGPYFVEAAGPSVGEPVRTHAPVFFGADVRTAERPGTSVRVEFRAAGRVEDVAGDVSRGPWKFWEDHFARVPGPEVAVYNPPTRANFALDPRKAGDAHIRKLDERSVGGALRNHWTGYYSQNVTSYVDEPSELMDPAFLEEHRGDGDAFGPADVAFVNWRYVLEADVSGRPGAAAPRIESFMLTYRFEPIR